jgi:hypothetical protein
VSTEVRRDTYGNPVDWAPTGRRRVTGDGHFRAEMVKGDSRVWMYCRPHEDCAACATESNHDACPVVPSNGTEPK